MSQIKVETVMQALEDEKKTFKHHKPKKAKQVQKQARIGQRQELSNKIQKWSKAIRKPINYDKKRKAR